MRQILIVTFILLTSSSVNGQMVKSIGIKGGVSIANQHWVIDSVNDLFDDTLDTENRTGLYFATTLEFLNSKYFRFITDFSYCEKGHTEKVSNTYNWLPEGDGTSDTYDTKFNYFGISPMLKVRYESDHFVPYALLGLRADWLTSYKSDINYSRIEDNFSKTIFGANFGAGLEIKIKQFGISIEGQYQYDFTKAMDTKESWNNGPAVQITNKAIIISLGLKYNFPE